MAEQKAGTVAILAMLSAAGSFILTCTGSPVWGLAAAFAAVIFGVIGVVVSASPKIGGGVASIAAIILGVIDIGLSILGIVGIILF